MSSDHLSSGLGSINLQKASQGELPLLVFEGQCRTSPEMCLAFVLTYTPDMCICLNPPGFKDRLAQKEPQRMGQELYRAQGVKRADSFWIPCFRL